MAASTSAAARFAASLGAAVPSSILPSGVSVGPCSSSRWVVPKRVSYMQCGRQLQWDMVDGAAVSLILLYHRERRAFILVRQFRPPLAVPLEGHVEGSIIDVDAESAFSWEPCGGLVERGHTPERAAVEEVEQECGFRVDPAALRKVATACGNVGSVRASIALPTARSLARARACLTVHSQSNGRLHMFYAEVGEAQRVSAGGGLLHEGECIMVVEVPVARMQELFDTPSVSYSPTLLTFYSWWRLNVDASEPKAAAPPAQTSTLLFSASALICAGLLAGIAVGRALSRH